MINKMFTTLKKSFQTNTSLTNACKTFSSLLNTDKQSNSQLQVKGRINITIKHEMNSFSCRSMVYYRRLIK